MTTSLRFICLLVALLVGVTAAGQSIKVETARRSAPPLVTAAATSERVRFSAPGGNVAQLRLEVFNADGAKVFDSEFRRGNLLDWTLKGAAQEQAQPSTTPLSPMPDGAYLCVVTVRTLAGGLRQRYGLLSLQSGQAALRAAARDELTHAQAQAWEASRAAQSLEPFAAESDDSAALLMLAADAPPSVAVTAHNGEDGQLTSTTGPLTFRTGDLFNGTETEQMRITPDGRVGIGTQQPQARLDVNGMIRARGGFQFADGSVLNLAPQGGLRITLPSGESAPATLAPSAVAATANRLPKFADAAGSLVDSALFEGANGFIGWGTTSPAHPFSVRRNGATLGVHSIGELYVDRDDRTRSASLTVGTAGTLKWIFGMPFQSDGFQVFDLTNNASRFFVDPTNGNIGVGTNAPAAAHKLDVVGHINTSTQYNLGGQRVLSAPGTNNLFVGPGAGNVNTGNGNTFIGHSAGLLNSSGFFNTFVGTGAGKVNTTGDLNSFFGVDAGVSNTTGSNNSFFGVDAGNSNTTGNNNSFFGFLTGDSNTTGGSNSFFGGQAGRANTTGGSNTFIGTGAGLLNTSGFSNSFVGRSAGHNNTTGSSNTFVGASAGLANTTGGGNSFFGDNAGDSNATGHYNTIIGNGADVTSGSLSYATAIGAGANVSLSNSVVLGRSADTVRIPGNLIVSGSVAKGSGSFKIDHPLDPLNKTLSHSFVESPDMMNVYNGNTQTDARGLAIVTLPSYFEALNRDFRYQLTVIGQFAQAIVLKKIAGNRFQIKTSKPRVEVSWQVTGIRKDAYAEAHRIPTEEQKPERERGTYMHPEAFTPQTTTATKQTSGAHPPAARRRTRR